MSDADKSRYAYAILVPAELVAAGIVIQYWTTSVHLAVWISIILVVLIVLNIFVVSIYGEAEFWFASIKIITIVGLIILGMHLVHLGLNVTNSFRNRSILWRRP